MANLLLDKLRENDKKGLFTASQTAVTYPTGFLPFDYKNGYKVDVRNMDEEIVDTYYNTGFVGGTFITVVGKSGTAKTTFVVQSCANIVRKYENAFVQHYDLEQALNYTRIKNITGMTQQEMTDKYVLKQEKNFIEDIFDATMKIALAKEENKNDFMYDTGLKDEFNRPIKCYVPTFIIVDSIPTVASKDSSNEMEGGTYANRVAKALAQFYKRLMPTIKAYNINIVAINHINTKMEINPMMKTQPQLMYMKMDEAVPGGNAPIYYANNFLKFVSVGNSKFAEEYGFDGFEIRCEFLKSRTNKAGKSVRLIYNQSTGFDPMISLYVYAKENDLITGRNPKCSIVGFPEATFDSRKLNSELANNQKLGFALIESCIKKLQKDIDVDTENKMTVGQYMDILEHIANAE